MPIRPRDGQTRRGRSAAARPQVDPAIDAGEAGAGAGVLGATTAAEPADAAYETQPARAGRGGVSVAAIIAGLAAAAILAGVGWYASQQHRGGLAMLTPGGAPAPSVSELPLTRVSDPSTPPSDTAATESSAPATHQDRARGQRAPNVEDEAANASDQSSPLQTPPSTAGAISRTHPTHLTPLAGTTSPVPPASTPSASSADPGSSPASTSPP